MKLPAPTWPQLAASAVLLIVVLAAVCFLPSQPAWSLLGQVATGAARAAFGQ